MAAMNDESGKNPAPKGTGPRRRRALILATVLGAIIIALGGYVIGRFADAPGPEATGAGAGGAAQLALGKKVYDAQCAACHGADLEGQPNWRQRLPSGELPAPPHDASGHTWHHPDGFLFAVTKLGTLRFAPPGYKSTMKGFADVLSDAEIHAVIAFIKAAWPPEIRARQADITARQRGG
jgi:mono/diheme cytochrome c family protein